VELRVIEIALISRVQDEQSRNTGAYEGRYKVAKDEITWLSKRSLDSAEEKDSRCAKRSDDSRCMIRVPEGCRRGHNSFDKEDTSERANPSKGPDFILDRYLAEPTERGNGRGS
jgi:hypothetical protein